MTETRQKQQIACDGVRRAWATGGSNVATVQSPQRLSIDGVLMRKEGTRVVHTVHSRLAPERTSYRTKEPRLSTEKVLRNLIDGIYIPRLQDAQRAG